MCAKMVLGVGGRKQYESIDRFGLDLYEQSPEAPDQSQR